MKLAIFSFAIALAGVATSWGSIIEVNFSGQITQSDFNSVKVGDSFSGTAFYSTTAAIQSSSPSPCPAPPAGCEVFYPIPLPISVAVAGSTISSDPNTTQDDLQLDVGDDAFWNTGFYLFPITGPLAAEQLSGFSNLILEFFGPEPFDSIQLPVPFPALGGFFASTGQWKSADVLFSTATGFSGPGTIQDGFTGNITSLSSQVFTGVPEPTATVTVCVALIAIAAFRTKRRLSALR